MKLMMMTKMMMTKMMMMMMMQGRILGEGAGGAHPRPLR